MSPVPLVLPLKASEAAALADLVYRQLEGKPLTSDLRDRFAACVPQLGLETFTPLPGSLARDPVHSSTYYIAIDAQSPMLLHITLASSPASELFPGAILIGRMRPGGGREIAINAVPFNSSDRESVRLFAKQIDPAFLPRPQGPQSAIVVEGPDFAAAFRAFRAIFHSTGLNLAATAGDYDAALWSAIRAGWREGWSAQDQTMFTAEETLERIGGTDDRVQGDLEIVMENTTVAAVSQTLDWMKSHGKPVQFVAVNLDSDIRALAEAVRRHNAILSFAGASEAQLEQIGIATAGRFHYRMQGDEEAVRRAASCLLGKTV